MYRKKPPHSGRKGRWNYSLPALLAIWAGTTALITLMGPFGTFPSITSDKRMLFWGSVIGLAIVLVATLRKMLDQFLSEETHPLLHDAIVAPVFTLLYTPPLYYITDSVARGQQPFNLVQQGMVVLAVSLALIAAREVLMKTIHSSHRALPPVAENEAIAAVNDSDDAAARPLIYERLPDEVKGNLMAISSSDHYVQVLTDCGSTSVLLRFSDALREIEGVPGQRVHRSHWVADSAVNYVRRDGYRHFVVLRSGDELPVSRTYADEAAERWGLMPTSPQVRIIE